MNEELNKALEQISDKHLNEAVGYQHKSFPWLRSIAAVLALVIAWTAIWAAFDFKRPIIVPQPDSVLQNPAAPNTTPTTPGTLPALPLEPSAPIVVDPGCPFPPDVPADTPDPPIITPPDIVLPPEPPIIRPLTPLLAQPTYPIMVQCPSRDIDPYSDEYQQLLHQWQLGKRQQYDQPEGYADSLTEFWCRSTAQFLSGDGNRAYSPANAYLALAMLAETTAGNSRQQILDLLGVSSIEALRTQVGHLWNAQYCDDGETTSLLANSLWLDDSYNFTKAIIQRLSEDYFASVYNGNLGSAEMNDLLKDWINSQTGGLLKEQTDSLEIPANTVFALCSALYYTAGWCNTFDKDRTADAIFHSTTGEITTAFMNGTMTGTYYWGSNFGAARLELTKGYMWLILPDEGYTVEDILKEDEYLSMALDPNRWKNQKEIILNLSLPKFDISTQSDLIEGLKKLGVTDVFQSGIADFSPMTNADTPYVSQVDHAVRVGIDEEGAMAAAYTVILVAPGSPPPPADEMDFVLNRPFLFMVTDDVPLFAGVVEQP